VSEILKTYGWQVLGIEVVHRFDDSKNYTEDVLDIADRAKTNPDACIVGTVFSYKPD